MRHFVICALILVFGCSGPARSAEYSLTLYGWLSGLSGDLGLVPGYPAQPVDMSFGDIFDTLDHAGFMVATARSGPWLLYFDGETVKTTETVNVGAFGIDSLKTTTQSDFMTVEAGRTILEGDRYHVDARAGLRFWWLDYDFTIALSDGAGARTGRSAVWTDPMIGFGGSYDLAPRWSLVGGVDLGGFGVGAHTDWGVDAAVQYHLNDTFDIDVGYRYLSVDYSRDGFVYDVEQAGPVVGVTLKF